MPFREFCKWTALPEGPTCEAPTSGDLRSNSRSAVHITIRTHIHISIYTHTYLFINVFIHLFLCTHDARMHTCMHACMHAYMHTCMHAYTHTHVRRYIHTYIPTYVHTFSYQEVKLSLIARCLALLLWASVLRALTSATAQFHLESRSE